MTFEDFKKAVIEAAGSLGLTDYELYYQTAESTSVSAFQHEVNGVSSSLEGGVSFRCLAEGHMGYASTEELSAESAADLVRRARDNAAVLETEEQEFLVEGGKAYTEPEKRDYPLPAIGELTQAVLAGQDALYGADSAVIDGSESEAFTSETTIAIMNSRGLDLSYTAKAAGFVSAAVVTDGQEMNNAYELKFGPFSELDIPATAGKAVADAKAKLGADVAPTGAYPVVFAPKAMASLLATFSGVFNAERARKGLSRLLEKEGEVIASEAVTLVDDPFYKDSAMPIGFDAEGNPAYKKNVIEKGKLNTLLYNLKTAAALGKETTGNASKAGYDAAVEIRPFTMYLAPGAYTEEALLQKAGNGVYIDSLGGLHAGANPISGDFSLQSSGFMIENGVKTRAVKSFTVAGNFYDLLKGVTALSDTVEMQGMGAGITAFASPAVLVEGLSVAGK